MLISTSSNILFPLFRLHIGKHWMFLTQWGFQILYWGWLRGGIVLIIGLNMQAGMIFTLVILFIIWRWTRWSSLRLGGTCCHHFFGMEDINLFLNAVLYCEGIKGLRLHKGQFWQYNCLKLIYIQRLLPFETFYTSMVEILNVLQLHFWMIFCVLCKSFVDIQIYNCILLSAEDAP